MVGEWALWGLMGICFLEWGHSEGKCHWPFASLLWLDQRTWRLLPVLRFFLIETSRRYDLLLFGCRSSLTSDIKLQWSWGSTFSYLLNTFFKASFFVHRFFPTARVLSRLLAYMSDVLIFPGCRGLSVQTLVNRKPTFTYIWDLSVGQHFFKTVHYNLV